MHDSVIRGLAPLYPYVTVFADDTLVTLGLVDRPQLEEDCATCVTHVKELVAANGLQLNDKKTEILVFIDIPNYAYDYPNHGWPTIRYQGEELMTRQSICYLGVILDNKLDWKEHIKRAVNRAAAALAPMMRLCRRTFGYSNTSRRIMINGAVYTHLLYCSSVFYHKLTNRPIQRAIESLQHRGDILATRAYSTTSAAAAVIQGSVPLDLRITRRSIRWLLQHDRPVPHWGPYDPIDEWPPPDGWEAASTR